MATTLLFSPLPSSAFLQKNPNLSSSYLSSFTPISISITKSSSNNRASISRRSTFLISATAVGYPVDTETSSASDYSRRKGLSSTSDVPDVSKGNESSLAIKDLGISQEIIYALSRRGITELFPIQRAVLEPAMAGRDMLGRAITGSGKTLAFGIPILDKIIRNRAPGRQMRNPSCLVLAPTRELARQVQKEFKDTAPNLSSVCLYGGMPIMNQVRQLEYGVDIAVGTPGRIIDLAERGSLVLSDVKFVVLDEADQMLAVGFQEDVECILNYLPKERQCMLFSATMPSWVTQLSRKYLRNPLTIDLVGETEQKLADGITLYSIATSSSGKENILPTLISTYGEGGKCIIFTRTKRDAEDLSRAMRASKALHGNMQQFQRDKTLAAFREGRFNVLVATDVAARGLDVPNVDLVVHFEIPNTPEIFVHRSGRTGRAGKKGTAILMYTKAQSRAVRDIERDLRCRFEELPRISVAAGDETISMDRDERRYGGGYDGTFISRPGASRSGSYGASRSGGYGGESRSGGYSGYGGESRSGGYGGYGGESRSGGYGGESRSGGYGGSRSGGNGGSRSGGYGRSRSGGYGGRSEGYSGSRSGGYGESEGYGGSRSGGYGESRSGGYGGSRSGGYGESRSGSTGGSRSGSYGGSQGQSYETRIQNPNRSRSEERSGGSEDSRTANFSRISDAHSTPFAKPRGAESNSYDDFKKNHIAEKGSVEKRREDGFKHILDMLKEQP